MLFIQILNVFIVKVRVTYQQERKITSDRNKPFKQDSALNFWTVNYFLVHSVAF